MTENRENKKMDRDKLPYVMTMMCAFHVAGGLKPVPGDKVGPAQWAVDADVVAMQEAFVAGPVPSMMVCLVWFHAAVKMSGVPKRLVGTGWQDGSWSDMRRCAEDAWNLTLVGVQAKQREDLLFRLGETVHVIMGNRTAEDLLQAAKQVVSRYLHPVDQLGDMRHVLDSQDPNCVLEEVQDAMLAAISVADLCRLRRRVRAAEKRLSAQVARAVAEAVNAKASPPRPSH